jgi:hypothetical protein
MEARPGSSTRPASLVWPARSDKEEDPKRPIKKGPDTFSEVAEDSRWGRMGIFGRWPPLVIVRRFRPLTVGNFGMFVRNLVFLRSCRRFQRGQLRHVRAKSRVFAKLPKIPGGENGHLRQMASIGPGIRPATAVDTPVGKNYAANVNEIRGAGGARASCILSRPIFWPTCAGCRWGC